MNKSTPKFVLVISILESIYNELVYLVFFVFSVLHTSYRHTVYFGFVRHSAKTENGCVTEMGLLGKIDHNSKLVNTQKKTNDLFNVSNMLLFK